MTNQGLLKRKPGAVVAAVALSLLASGCNFLPSGGPRFSPESKATVDFPHVLVPVTADVVSVLTGFQDVGSFGMFKSRKGPADIRLGVGDVVQVTIFEATTGGLFIPAEPGSRPGNYITVPDQQVDRRGNITVPYAGQIPVVGKTIPEVQAAVVATLSSRAIEPQVVITLNQQRSAQVSVIGEVNQPVQFAVNPAGDRVLDAIARAGGPKIDGFDTYVTLQRGSRKATVYFNRLVRESSNNVYVQPGDVIYVFRQARSFVGVGAAGANGKFNFEDETLNLAEAIGKVQGLDDDRANPAGVLVYRQEPRAVAERLGIDVSAWTGPTVPVIYNVNLSEQPGFFLARDFPVRDKDIVYISNATSVELAKFLALLRLGLGAGNDFRDVTRF